MPPILIGDICPKGHYCENATVTPNPCPASTFSDVTGNIDISNCQPCLPSFICPVEAIVYPSVPCPAGFVCPVGTASASIRCTPGHYCPLGSAEEVDCAPGTYQDDFEADSCKACPSSYYCPLATVTPFICPSGFYCPPSTPLPNSFPCPNATFSNVTGLSVVSECTLSLPGTASISRGLSLPSHLCGPGHYCLRGASTIFPTESDQGGLCDAGYVCLEGAFSPTPADYVTGYPSPPGTYSPPGSSQEIGCEPGTFNPTFAAGSCLPCPPGALCVRNTTHPDDCPLYSYCPGSTSQPILCPPGTYGDSVNLTSSHQCTQCIGGHYCVDGRITGECSEGHFCKVGQSSPTPEAFPSPTEAYDVAGYVRGLEETFNTPRH